MKACSVPSAAAAARPCCAYHCRPLATAAAPQRDIITVACPDRTRQACRTALWATGCCGARATAPGRCAMRNRATRRRWSHSTRWNASRRWASTRCWWATRALICTSVRCGCLRPDRVMHPTYERSGSPHRRPPRPGRLKAGRGPQPRLLLPRHVRRRRPAGPAGAQQRINAAHSLPNAGGTQRCSGRAAPTRLVLHHAG